MAFSLPAAHWRVIRVSQLGATYTFSPTLVTDFRFGAFRYRVRVQPNGVGTTPALDAGLPGLNLGTTETSGMPAFYINGNGSFDFGYALGVNQCNCPLKEDGEPFPMGEQLDKNPWESHHRMGRGYTAGAAAAHSSDSHRSGEMHFNDDVTGSATVDGVAAGNAPPVPGWLPFSSVFRVISAATLPESASTLACVSRVCFSTVRMHGGRLLSYIKPGPEDMKTIFPRRQQPRRCGSFDPNTARCWRRGLVLASNMGGQAYNSGFAPRLGVAYQIQFHTVLRAGYGGLYGRLVWAVFGQAPDYDPQSRTHILDAEHKPTSRH